MVGQRWGRVTRQNPRGLGVYLCKPARAAAAGTFPPNQPGMCPQCCVCRHNTSAASCLDLLAVEIVVGHRSETSPHQASKPNLFCHPADKYAHTFTHMRAEALSEQREVGLKLRQTVQPKLRLSMESSSFFSSPVLSFDATFVINSDKSSGSSPLMCARHIARTHKHTSRIHHPQ